MLRILGAIRGRRWITFGIRRENKGKWESRAPLTPTQCVALRSKIGAQFIIQPSNLRVFSDSEYKMAGVLVNEDLSAAEVVLGIKEVPVAHILPNKTYFCFSHTHKGQPHNMKMLKKFIDGGCTLVDYELLKDHAGHRLVAFGKYAGYAGTINCLHGLGLKLLEKGYRTPFLNIGQSHTYPSLQLAINSIRAVGEEIAKFGLPSEVSPLLIVVTGGGNVSQGALEILRHLPIKLLSSDVETMYSDPQANHHIYVALTEAQDYCQRKDGNPFNLEEYHQNPELYASLFHDKYAPHATAIINGIYWEPKFPRLLTKKQTDEILANPRSRLVSIADISCDINGSIEVTDKATTIDNPFFDYKSSNGEALQLMTVDNLPAQLPRDSTEFFGEKLSPVLEQLVSTDGKNDIISSATIVERGNLTHQHAWLTNLVTSAGTVPLKKRVLILGSGYVAGPVVKYLNERKNMEIIMGSNNIKEAGQLNTKYPSLQIEEVDIHNSTNLDNLLCKADVVISLIPATMHIPVAEACLRLRKHMVTASYISPAMQTLHEQAKMKDLVFLNEIGLDPGLDHLSAKKIIDETQSMGSEIISFKSWCGGLPAPECADNPLMYKFSWSPRGVLLAALNNAQYRISKKDHSVPGNKLLENYWSLPFKSPLSLEGLPNRNSLKYIEQYGLSSTIPTMLRGTLRYSGFSSLLSEFRTLGLLSLDPLPSILKTCNHWRDAINTLSLWNVSPACKNAMQWLGVFDNAPFAAESACMLDAFCTLLQSKMKYKEGERDMVVMHHEFIIKNQEGLEYKKESSLIQYGNDEFSAMARTVGYPVAIAAEMVVDGLIQQRGVIAPLTPTIYNPMLSKLESLVDIRFKETSSPPSDASFNCL